MSDDYEYEDLNEEAPGEDAERKQVSIELTKLPSIILDKALTFEEASRCLNTLGKDESGIRYSYLMISATNRKLTDVSIILNFKHVLFVDLSSNCLTLENLQVLTKMPFLIFLKVERNRMDSAALHSAPFLQVLKLGGNVISETSDIAQELLETLDLSNNEISEVAFDHLLLPRVKSLDLHGNNIKEISGTYPTTLEKLYLASNDISRFNADDLLKLRHLTTLHLRYNNIKKFRDNLQVDNLKYLNLRNNKIKYFKELKKLQDLAKLEILIVSENPVSGEKKEQQKGEESEGEEQGEDREVRDKCVVPILTLLPNLKRINKHIVTLNDRDDAERGKAERLDRMMSEGGGSIDEETAATTNTTDFATDFAEEESSVEDEQSW